MATYDTFDIVRVPFPFTDRLASKRRPAPVLSSPAAFDRVAKHSVLAMITSKGHLPWPLDCPIGDLGAAGLPAPSVVRFKLFTLDHQLLLGKLGRLSPEDTRRVAASLRELLPLDTIPFGTKE